MEGISSYFTWLTASFLAAIFTVILLPWIYSINKSPKQKPPGPPAWPLIGNIFTLGRMPHQNLYQLRPKYGPVLWLKLGSIDTMVVQSAKAAANLFKNNDLSFSDRKISDAMTAWNYNQGSLAFGNYGPYWRLLRKLCSMELLVNKRVKDSTEIREKCVEKMIDWMEKNEASAERTSSGEVELVHSLFIMAFNVVANLMFSRDLLDFDSDDQGHEFFDAMSKVMMWAGKPNIADFLPFLRWLDPLNVKKNMMKDMGIALNIVSSFVKERSHETMSTKTVKNDFLNMLLEYKNDEKEGPGKISEKNINIIILEMFFAGSETTSSTIEWAMAELLRHPESMRKVKAELHSVVMPFSRSYVKESDIDKLPYLHAVVKETLRLHPAIPLLIPRNTMEDTNFMGYHIPKSTQVFVNAWAIGRDPDAWEDALSFQPERFLGSNIDYKGQHFELIPFGSGRRICVGMALADRVVHLSLANFLWTFDWELGSSVTPDNIDMSERMGITLRMKEPLKAIPRRRSL